MKLGSRLRFATFFGLVCIAVYATLYHYQLKPYVQKTKSWIEMKMSETETELTRIETEETVIHLEEVRIETERTKAEIPVDKTNYTETAPTPLSNCSARRNIVFLKTHKTASSAVQNQLFRYGLKHDLRIALPRNKHDFGFPSSFRKETVNGKGPFNIICNHMRFNAAEVEKVMPKDSFYFSIVREPGELFESCFDYFWGIVPAFQRVPHKNSTEKWLDKANEFVNSAKKGKGYWMLAKSPTVYDFGFENFNENSDYIKSTIAAIERRFDLIMVADHFEESTVLLSEALCWPLEELACLTLNARNRAKIDLEKKARIRSKARNWNKADAALFDHFNSTLWRKVEAYGVKRMAADLARLHNATEVLSVRCIEGGNSVDSRKLTDKAMKGHVFRPGGVDVLAYNLKKGMEEDPLCRQLVLPENAFNNLVFKHQFGN